MKKYFCVLLLLITATAYPQFKNRETSETYFGAAIGMNLFTNSDVSGTYPMFDVDNSSFFSNVSPYVGYKLSSTFSFEISPMVSIAKTYDKGGFYFSAKTGENLYYKPQNLSLALIPILARVKVFPFASNLKVNNFKAGWYSGCGAGIAYLNESYDNFVYANEYSFEPLYIRTDKRSYWTPAASLFFGWESATKYAFGFEIGYNFIPTKTDRTNPLMVSVAGNFNNFYFSVKGRLGL
jgi:hypothetical protein